MGCGSRPPPPLPAPPAERIAIVAAERGPRGARLVAIDERGDRRFELVAAVPAGGPLVRDTHPAISPDGRWLVFASTRERRDDATSLWLAPLAPGAVPRRLTTGAATDSHPAWTADGSAIIFASTRARGDFDLWRLPVAAGRAAGPAVALTSSPAHEVTPAVARDGTIVYAAITPTGGREVASRLEVRAPDGAIHALTAGPADTSPALSPDGASIAFARPALHLGTPHSELWRMPRADPAAAAVVVALPLTDESGPVWSPDGRYLFATSVLRAADGEPLFSSVIHVELGERPARARILGDRAGPIARLTPAIAGTPLDRPALRADPEYLGELARIVTQAITKAAADAASEAAP